VLALTLFRATYQTVQTAGEPDGELQQPLAFNYVLMPFAGAFNPVRARRIVDAAQAGVRTHGTAEPVTPRSFLRLDDGGVVVTAIKAADDGEGGVVRLWNPAEADLEEVIHTEPAAASAQLCDLNETPQQDIKLEDGAIPVTVKAGGLATVRFTW
jgi:alpha-mannosidase